jgi:hypothetical protein
VQPPLTQDEDRSQAAPSPETVLDGSPAHPAGEPPGLPDNAAAQANSPDPQDRRAAVRRKRLIRVRIADPGVLFEPYTGWVVDRSLGGFCLSVDQPIEEGRILRLRATDAPVHIPWVEVHVNRCLPRDESWEVGCDFVHSPSWEALLTFG